MKFANDGLGKILIGHQAPMALLKGRDYRPDRRRLFSEADEAENIWYQTFSVGLDQCCREACFILGIRLCSFAADGGSEMDVDGIGEAGDKEGPDETEAAGGGDDEEDENGEGWDEEEPPWAKRIMDILPLDARRLGGMRRFLAHDAAMILKGCWLPESFSPEGALLPRHLAGRFPGGAGRVPDDAFPILDGINFSLRHDPADESFQGGFDLTANRGTRCFACSFQGNQQGGQWRINDFSVDSYASTGSGFGNLFSRPSILSDNGHGCRQACLLLIDFYEDEEFGELLN